MSKLSRVKGATWERKLANLFKTIWPTAKRGIGQTRAASEVADVDGTPFWVEAKHWKKTTRGNLNKAWEQAQKANNTSKPCVVIAKENCSRDIVVVMSGHDFTELFVGNQMGIYGPLPRVQIYLEQFLDLCIENGIGGAIRPTNAALAAAEEEDTNDDA